MPQLEPKKPTKRLVALLTGSACILLIFISLIALVESTRVWSRPGTSTVVAPQRSDRRVYQVGTTIALPGVDFHRAAYTLIFVLRAECTFCTSSMGVMRSLTTHAKSTQKVRVIAASTDSPPVANLYLTKHGVAIDELIQVEAHSLRITGVPTTLLIDSDAIVRGVWRGVLDEVREVEIKAAIDPVGQEQR